jgi:nucleotide-binding universal stress UspA family protein
VSCRCKKNSRFDVLLEGSNIWPSLQQMIVDHNIDFVVAGTHGRGRVQKLLMGISL